MSLIPNHVTNFARAPRDVIHGLLTEAGVDFNRIIPMPPDDDPMFTAERHTTTGPDGRVVSQAWSFDGFSPMDWARLNWGTKWNAYDYELFEDDTIVVFDTAWSHPYPVMIEWSKQFPNTKIQVMYADEDLGQNLGVYVIERGTIIHLPCPDEGTDQARELASLIKYRCHYDDLVADIPDPPRFTVPEIMNHALHLTTGGS